MNPTPPAPARPALRGNFVLLRADALRLLLPQHEVGGAEYLDARPQCDSRDGVFEVAQGSGTRRVAALSQQMTLLPQFPADRFMVTMLGSAGNGIVWAWNEVKVLSDANLQPRSLPPVLCAPDMPLGEYVEDGEGIAFLCSAQRLDELALQARG